VVMNQSWTVEDVCPVDNSEICAEIDINQPLFTWNTSNVHVIDS
jgi:hypothetical protein